MKTVELTDALRKLLDDANELENEIIVLTSDKKPVAALISLKNVDKESLSLSTNPEFMKIIEAAREEFRVGKRLSLEEMKQELLK